MKVFISHSYKDSELASLIQNKLIEYGLSVIQIDPHPKIGDNIALQMEKAVHSADAFVILLSKHYFDSKWSDLELMMIYDHSMSKKKAKRIFPILLDKSVRIPSLLSNLVYADFTDKKESKLNDFAAKISEQISIEASFEHKKIRNLLKEQEQFLKLQEIEYQLQRNKQKKIRSVFQWSFLMIAITSLVTTILLFSKKLDFQESIYFSVNIQNVIFYLFGFLTAIIPSLYLIIKTKNRNNGK